jgi:hypothetical protein
MLNQPMKKSIPDVFLSHPRLLYYYYTEIIAYTASSRKSVSLSAAGPYVRRTKHSPSPRNVNDTDREANECQDYIENNNNPSLYKYKKNLFGGSQFSFLNQKRKRVEIIFRASACCFFVSKADGRGMGAGYLDAAQHRELSCGQAGQKKIRIGKI